MLADVVVQKKSFNYPGRLVEQHKRKWKEVRLFQNRLLGWQKFLTPEDLILKNVSQTYAVLI